MITNKEEQQELQALIDKQELEMGRVFLWGDISEESVHNAIRQMRYIFFANKNKNIYIYIHSDGGDDDASYAMQDEMAGLNKLGATIYTIALGKAYSAAAEILAAGNERYATKNSRLMMHPVSYSPGHDYISQQLAYSNFMDKINKESMISAAKNCGYSTKREIEIFADAIKDGLWMTAAEAIDFGLIDNIWDYRWEREITGLE